MKGIQRERWKSLRLEFLIEIQLISREESEKRKKERRKKEEERESKSESSLELDWRSENGFTKRTIQSSRVLIGNTSFLSREEGLKNTIEYSWSKREYSRLMGYFKPTKVRNTCIVNKFGNNPSIHAIFHTHIFIKLYSISVIKLCSIFVIKFNAITLTRWYNENLIQ